jgi:hypothetical protein
MSRRKKHFRLRRSAADKALLKQAAIDAAKWKRETKMAQRVAATLKELKANPKQKT